MELLRYAVTLILRTTTTTTDNLTEANISIRRRQITKPNVATTV